MPDIDFNNDDDDRGAHYHDNDAARDNNVKQLIHNLDNVVNHYYDNWTQYDDIDYLVHDVPPDYYGSVHNIKQRAEQLLAAVDYRVRDVLVPIGGSHYIRTVASAAARPEAVRDGD